MMLLHDTKTCAGRRCASHAACGLFLLSVLSLPVSAHAAMPGDFAAADINHDDRVTLPEFESYARARLMAADGMRARAFRSMSPTEQDNRLKTRFEQMDRGGKGYLDRGDWNAG
ncbi:hypothetical protein NFI95_03680 [Acetobacteraceae bacterium KSS8]|uniref:EF-hand domain-containing protein n=1 Tax=Endosaccharibacter trunci TaxID=2812733 RepID=A0ABT1W3V2_9PROT|nr:hypothetical protein [Acetobacteraceae bacterium KSS8]